MSRAAINYDQIHDEWRQAWECAHPSVELRQKRAVNGQALYREQCLRCGASARILKTRNVDPRLIRNGLPSYDEELHRRWFTRSHEDLQRRRDVAEQSENAKWWRWYNQYLTSPEWRQKRRLVLLRDGGLCQGCRTAKAAQVHHLTYDRAGNELLFDLVSICPDCHQRAHPDKVLRGGDD